MLLATSPGSTLVALDRTVGGSKRPRCGCSASKQALDAWRVEARSLRDRARERGWSLERYRAAIEAIKPEERG